MRFSISKNRYVIVRIWSSGLCGGADVGHVSLEVRIDKQSEYISLWPNIYYPREGIEAKPLFNSLTDDIHLEERDPERVFYLFSLRDLEKIVGAFRERQKNLIHWRLSSQKKNTDSCATFVYQLLKLGGIENISTNFSASSSRFSTFTPDGLAGYLSQVVSSERRHFSQTASWENDVRKPNYKITASHRLGDCNFKKKQGTAVEKGKPEGVANIFANYSSEKKKWSLPSMMFVGSTAICVFFMGRLYSDTDFYEKGVNSSNILSIFVLLTLIVVTIYFFNSIIMKKETVDKETSDKQNLLPSF